MLDQPEFYQAIRQQAQGPALLSRRRRATRQGNQMGFHLTGELLGSPRWQRLMVERRL
jgi:hypothetical protein